MSEETKPAEQLAEVTELKPNPVEKTPGMLAQDAERVIFLDRQKREHDCAKKLEALLQEHGCTIDVAVEFSMGKPPQFKVNIKSVK